MGSRNKLDRSLVRKRLVSSRDDLIDQVVTRLPLIGKPLKSIVEALDCFEIEKCLNDEGLGPFATCRRPSEAILLYLEMQDEPVLRRTAISEITAGGFRYRNGEKRLLADSIRRHIRIGKIVSQGDYIFLASKKEDFLPILCR